eukprot:222229-Prorocentrum_minimum.AAC.2
MARRRRALLVRGEPLVLVRVGHLAVPAQVQLRALHLLLPALLLLLLLLLLRRSLPAAGARGGRAAQCQPGSARDPGGGRGSSGSGAILAGWWSSRAGGVEGGLHCVGLQNPRRPPRPLQVPLRQTLESIMLGYFVRRVANRSFVRSSFAPVVSAV